MIVKKMFRGDDKYYELTVKDRITKLPVDITGCTIKMTWKKVDGTQFLQKDFTLTDPVNGLAEVKIEKTDTNSLTEKTVFDFDVQITKTTDDVETLIKGKFTVEMDVT